MSGATQALQAFEGEQDFGPDLQTDIFDSFFGTTNSDSEKWPTPQEIKSELLPVHPLPEGIIPEAFLPWIADIALRMQCPIDFIAAPALVMTGAVIGTGCGIRPKQHDDWLVVPNLWGGLVSRPGMLKSPAMVDAFWPLKELEKKARDEHKDLLSTHQAEIEALEAQKTSIKHKMQLAAKADESLDPLKLKFAALKEPERSVMRRYGTNNATVEKLHVLLSENPRGLLVSRDELIGLLSTWDKEGHQSDRAFFLEGWTGNGSHTHDTISRGSIHADRLCISLFGGIQPSKLVGYLHDAMSGSENDGLVQRLQLLVYPDKLGWEYTDLAPDAAARQRVLSIMQQLASADFTRLGALAGHPPFFRFDTDAQALFKEWLTDLEKRLRDDTDAPIMLEHLSKYRSLMPSLALIFHLIHMSTVNGRGPVSLQAAEMAAAWCDYLESHAMRIYGLVSNIGQKAAARLAVKITSGELQDGFTVRDVYRNGWSLLSKPEVAQSACDELAEKGWLREQVTEAGFQQRSATRYIINPKAKERR